MLTVAIWIVFGLVVGLIAKALMAQRHKSSLPMTILLGVGGALLGGILSQFIFGFSLSLPHSLNETFNGSFILSLLFAVLGAIILSAIFQIVLNNKES